MVEEEVSKLERELEKSKNNHSEAVFLKESKISELQKEIIELKGQTLNSLIMQQSPIPLQNQSMTASRDFMLPY